MGTDIHLMSEYKFKRSDGKEFWFDLDVGYSERNYSLFGQLANVRNGSGFGGCDLGDPVRPVSDPRGAPSDVGYMVGSKLKEWGLNGHSHSWLSLKELIDYKTDAPIHTHRGLVELKEYKHWKESGEKEPRGSCGDVSGPNVIKISQEQADKKDYIENDKDRIYVRSTWHTTALESADIFWNETVPSLELVAKNRKLDYSDIRIVFWFDS